MVACPRGHPDVPVPRACSEAGRREVSILRVRHGHLCIPWSEAVSPGRSRGVGVLRAPGPGSQRIFRNPEGLGWFSSLHGAGASWVVWGNGDQCKRRVPRPRVRFIRTRLALLGTPRTLEARPRGTAWPCPQATRPCFPGALLLKRCCHLELSRRAAARWTRGPEGKLSAVRQTRLPHHVCMGAPNSLPLAFPRASPSSLPPWLHAPCAGAMSARCPIHTSL